MSRYRKVDPRIWNDEKFRALSNKGKLVFFMLLTHPSMTSLGAMRGTLAGLAEELGWPVEAFREAFADVLNQGMAEHDPKACLIALPNFVRYNLPESPNVVRAWVGALDLLPECDLKQHVVQRAGEIAGDMQEGFGRAFREAFDKTSPNPKQKPKQKNSPPPPADAGGAFESFWNAWPDHKRKVAKAQCERKWEAKACEDFADKVIAAVLAMVKSEDWTKEGGEYIPAPLVWLNQERWQAAPAVSAPATVLSDAAEKHKAALDADATHGAEMTPERRADRIARARAAVASATRSTTEEAPAMGEETHANG